MCDDKSASMLCIDSAAHNEYVVDEVVGGLGVAFWLGYHDSAGNGTFEPPAGCESGYTNWAEGQPGTPTGDGQPGYAYGR